MRPAPYRAATRKGEPAVGTVQQEGVRRRGSDLAGVRPAQQPVPAVGEDADADAAAGRLRLGQVIVQLLDVLRIRLETAGGTDAALELHKGVEGGEVDGLTAEILGGRFSSTISSLSANPVRMRKSRTALVMLASASKLSCRRRIRAAAAR